MKRIIFYLPALFLIFANTTLAKQSTIADMDFDLNPNKTVEDAMIEVYYNHPEVISDIDAECSEIMGWIDNSINYGMEKYYHRAILCLTWEVNKKLDKKQMDLLVKLKSTLTDTIVRLTNKDNYGAVNMMYANYESKLMLLKKIYNMIYSASLPVCLDNSRFNHQDRASAICKQKTHSYIMNCKNEENIKTCIDKKNTEKLSSNTIQELNPQTDICQLKNLTDEFISSLYIDKNRQNMQILDFYDFYIRLIDDINYDVRYNSEHNI